MSPTAVLNLHTHGYVPYGKCYPHINSYVPYCSVKPPHTWEKTEFLTLVEDIYNIQHGIMKESINLNI